MGGVRQATNQNKGESMKVLVMYESSGTVREAFRRLGHDAHSLDLQKADDGSPHHLKMDAGQMMSDIERGHVVWDLIIAHPPCTYLTSSAAWAYKDGPYHMKIGPEILVGAERRAAREEALQTVQRIMNLPCERIVIENPVGAISKAIRPPEQYIQPYQFGHSASKKTGLWLKGVEPLLIDSDNYVEPEYYHEGKPRWANQSPCGATKLPPSADRWKIRSKTYQGIADAMANQWGDV